jgi:hypothetical protein
MNDGLLPFVTTENRCKSLPYLTLHHWSVLHDVIRAIAHPQSPRDDLSVNTNQAPLSVRLSTARFEAESFHLNRVKRKLKECS